MSSNFGMVNSFFANRAFAANGPSVHTRCLIHDSVHFCYCPFPTRSQNACRSKAWTGSRAIVILRGKLSSPRHYPLIISHCASIFLGKTASQGRCQSHPSPKTVFLIKVTRLATLRGSYKGQLYFVGLVPVITCNPIFYWM